MLQCVLQCVAVCVAVCVARHCSVLHCGTVYCSVLLYVAVCYNELQCGVVCRGALDSVRDVIRGACAYMNVSCHI